MTVALILQRRVVICRFCVLIPYRRVARSTTRSSDANSKVNSVTRAIAELVRRVSELRAYVDAGFEGRIWTFLGI